MSESKGQISKEKMTDLERAFKVFDKNQDGRISKEELDDVLKEAGINCKGGQLDEFMQKIDLDKNGSIDYNEFCTVMNGIILVSAEKQRNLQAVFDSIDVNGDGKIQDTELKTALTQLTGVDVDLEEARAVIGAVDKDGDGHINFKEFVTMLHVLQLDS